MSDLISRNALLEELNNYHYDTVNAQTRRIEHIVNAHFIEIIEKRPAAFDVEKVIAELEQERDKCYEQMKKIEEKGENETDYFDGHIFDEYHNQGIGLNKAIDIINKYLSANAEPPKKD